MHKYLRNTRRGWMIFSAPDQGGGSAVADPPAAPAKPSQAGDETSKSIFAQEMAKVSTDAPPTATEPLSANPPAEPPSAPPKADEPSAAPPVKSSVPADVLDPSAPPAPKVHDAVAEIQSAELPKNAKKEQIDSFNKLKTKAADHLQAALDRAAELEKKISSGDATKAELAELEKKLADAQTRAAEIEERWSKEAYASSPQFRAKFADREQTALELAKSYLDGTEIKADIIDLAAHATGRKQIEILKDAGIDEATIQLISPHLANFATIQREKAAALDNWKVASKQERAEAEAQAQRAAAARAEQENKIWETVVPKLDLLPFRKSKDNPDWNNRADQLLEQARRLYNGDGADLPEFAERLAKGFAYDVQDEVVNHLRTENQSLREENARLKSAAPGGHITAGTQDGKPIDTSKMSREEVAKATFNQEKQRAGAA